MSSANHVLDKISNLKLPNDVKATDIAVAVRDAEILIERMKQNPDKMQTLLNAALSNHTTLTEELVKELRITEQDIVADGGGFLWLIVIVVLLYSTNAY